jgi:hypothetical protein
MKHFSEDEKLSLNRFLKALTASKLNDSFLIMVITLKLFVSIPCSNSSGEKSSVLKRVKNYQRTYSSNENMPSLALMSIKNIFLKNIDWNDIIK